MNNLISIAITTCPNLEEAEKIANILVEEKFAACVNIIPNITSVYFWENKVQKETELLLVIKTTSSNISNLKTKLLSIHSYDVPEFVVINSVDASEAYLKWVVGNCK